MRRLHAIVSWPLTFGLLAGVSPQDPPSSHRFFLDGEEVAPVLTSIDGIPGRLGPQDLFELEGFAMRIGEQEVRRLMRVVLEGRTVRLLEEERGRVVACDADGLLELERDQRRSLLGVRIERWDEDIAAALADLDLARTVVTLTEGTAQGEEHALPPLPGELRALVVESNAAPGFGDWRALRLLSELRSLRLKGRSNAYSGLHLDDLAGATQLRSLDLGAHATRGAESLSSFGELRRLVGEGQLDTKSLSFVDDMPRLRVLRLAMLGLERFDLSRPADALTTLDVAYNDDLEGFRPELFPALEHLDLAATSVPPEAVKAYRKAHPACRIVYSPEQETLDLVLARCDRLRVRSGGTCHLDGSEETLIDERDPEQLELVLSWLRIVEDHRIFYCGCCGEPTLELYEGENLIASLGFHHGRSIRWGDGDWVGDALLVPESAQQLVSWMTQRGVEGLER